MQDHKLSNIDPVNLFRVAERTVRAAGFGWEIAWQRRLTHREFTESDFLREAAWVILCSGFREAVVRKVFDYMSLCFCDWESAREIQRNRASCIATASARFRSPRKLSAIADIADLVAESGFQLFQAQLKRSPIQELQKLPFIGPVTAFHLAKNLGIDVAKNDRHLVRIANTLGFPDAHALCDGIAIAVGEPISVVDIVLWRYAAIGPRLGVIDKQYPLISLNAGRG